MSNPYLEAWRRRTTNRRRADGLLSQAGELLGPVAATVLLTPLLQPVFLEFLGGPEERWAEGAAGVALRFGLLVAAWLSLDVFTALIRAPDRAILAVLPVDPLQVVRTALWEVALRRWWMLPAVAAVLSPLALAGAPGLWALAMMVVAGAWATGMMVSAWVHLRAVDVAEDPAWAGWLDRVRGSNPREQAAFLYAPGVVILFCGTLIQFACNGLLGVAGGQPAWALAILAPFPVAAFAWTRLAGRAPSWFTGSLVLAEIDARYSVFADPEEGRRVYLDWVVRWLPERMGLYALKDLRHGWRARRSWITGAWLLAIGAFAAGWNGTELGPIRATDVAMASGWLCAGVGVLMGADEPGFLRAWLPSGGPARSFARTLVLWLWVQPPAWLGAGAVLLRRGVSDALNVLLSSVAIGLFASAFAVACGALGRRGLAVYAPFAAVAAGAGAAWLGA